ncbi:MAG: EAL domain-containing protein [Gemmatimonadota bacterium]|nr:EAL domain-containing protein [Gemmatimonadota bacterium]
MLFPQELSLVAISGGGYICIVRDLTDQGSAQVALTAALQHQTALLNNIPDLAWIKDTQSRFVAVNEALAAAYGLPGGTLVGQTDRAFFPAEIAERYLADDDRVMRSGERITTEYSVPWPAGAAWIETTKTAVLDVDGQVIGTVGIARDITARRRADDALRASEAQLRAIVDRSAIGIVVTDPAGLIVSANPAYQRMVGYSAVELQGRRAMDFAAPEDRELTMKAANELRSGVRDTITIEKRYVQKGGGTVWTSVTLSSIEAGTDGPRITGIVAMVQDISGRKALEATLLYRASHDELTGLPNRTYFRERVERALARPDRSRDRIAVLFVDLDDFKAVNDSLGHSAGDQFLAIAAERLLNATRGSDTVARLGGDEFGILIENAERDADVAPVAMRITTALSSAVQLEGVSLAASASIGIAYASDVDSAEQLLRNADLAMYRAKAAGKGHQEAFRPEMHETLMHRMELDSELRRALACDGLSLAYQPIVDLVTGRTDCVEALTRWVSPSHGPVGPGEFIRIAEQSGLILPLGRWVLEHACREAAQWSGLSSGGVPPAVSVNVSGRQLEDGGFLTDVVRILSQTGLNPDRLVLELTESVLMRDPARALERLLALRAVGVRIAVDDFGTGYSSLAQLRRFPVTMLKIDREFIRGIGRNTPDVEVVRAIIALGKAFSLDTVAEGVETREQLAALRELGCEHAQGFLLARPGPYERDALMRPELNLPFALDNPTR